MDGTRIRHGQGRVPKESAQEARMIEPGAVQDEDERNQHAQRLENAFDHTVGDRQEVDQIERERKNHEDDNQENESAHWVTVRCILRPSVAIVVGPFASRTGESRLNIH
jgi:hypothetical protein